MGRLDRRWRRGRVCGRYAVAKRLAGGEPSAVAEDLLGDATVLEGKAIPLEGMSGIIVGRPAALGDIKRIPAPDGQQEDGQGVGGVWGEWGEWWCGVV